MTFFHALTDRKNDTELLQQQGLMWNTRRYTLNSALFPLVGHQPLYNWKPVLGDKITWI